ncbi:MAG: hypothetical protein V1895_00745 [Parcubacteria group bacterium]
MSPLDKLLDQATTKVTQKFAETLRPDPEHTCKCGEYRDPEDPHCIKCGESNPSFDPAILKRQGLGSLEEAQAVLCEGEHAGIQQDARVCPDDTYRDYPCCKWCGAKVVQ